MPAANAVDGDATRWAQLFAQVGAEVAQPLTAALERVHALAHAGRLDGADHHGLLRDLAQARRVAMIAQQLARLADAGAQPAPEPIRLERLLAQVVAECQPRARARGTPLLESARAATVITDAPLAYRLLHAMLDWALAHSCSALHLGIDLRPWPVRARLHLRFRHRPIDEVADPKAPTHAAALDTIDWQLLRQAALAMGLVVERADTACGCRVTVEFPRTVYEPVVGADAGVASGFEASTGSRALAGHHVLVLAARRDLRAEARAALRPLGVLVDFAASVETAREFCRSGAPHALVYDALLAGERMRSLHAELRALAPAPALIELVDDGRSARAPSPDGTGVARVARATLAHSLPAALAGGLLGSG